MEVSLWALSVDSDDAASTHPTAFQIVILIKMETNNESLAAETRFWPPRRRCAMKVPSLPDMALIRSNCLVNLSLFRASLRVSQDLAAQGSYNLQSLVPQIVSLVEL